VEKLEQFLKDVIRVLVSRAEAEIDHLMPGYTHLQVRLLRSRFVGSDRLIVVILSVRNQFAGHTSSSPTLPSSSTI
jgi:hypothetical protein